jgi:hypothetical protein
VPTAKSAISKDPYRTWRSAMPAPGTGVSDGTRTRDILDHNQVLYQLSYTHHATASAALLTMVAVVVSGSPIGHLTGDGPGRRPRFLRARAW